MDSLNTGRTHFLYRHIRLDKNEVFYVGVGTVRKENWGKAKLERAYKIKGRTDFWKRIAAKGFEVEIILISNDLNFILNKEKEFIKLYGKKTNGGTLVNFRDGGGGVSQSSRANKASIEIKNLKTGEIKLFESSTAAAIFLNCSVSLIGRLKAKKAKSIKSWSLPIPTKRKSRVKKSLVIDKIKRDYSKTHFIRLFHKDHGWREAPSYNSFANEYNLCRSLVRGLALGRYLNVKGWVKDINNLK